MSVQPMLAAARFSRAVGDIEAAHNGEPYGPFWEEVLHDATACIFCCVASIESYANEMFADRGEVFAPDSFSVKSPELLKDPWNTTSLCLVCLATKKAFFANWLDADALASFEENALLLKADLDLLGTCILASVCGASWRRSIGV